MSRNTFVLPTPSSARGRRWVSSLTRCGTILAGGSGRLRLLADWLRKHLGVHLAQSHQIFSPARHLAHGDTCVNCLKCFRTAARHQQHLRTTATCMLWTCLLVPCLSVEEMRAEEGSAVKVAKRIRGGAWSSFTATLPALQAQEPRQLTSSKRLDLLGEEADLGLMSRLFYPDPHFLSWVEHFLADRSTEGPRSSTASFWDRRPLPRFT